MVLENLHEVPRHGVTNFPYKSTWAYNRTGAATIKGGIYAFDVQQTAPLETVANSKGEILPAVFNNYGQGSDGAFGNIVLPVLTMTVAGGGLDSVFGIALPMCVALSAVNDNELVEVVEQGEVTLTLTTQGYGAAPGVLNAWRRVTPIDSSALGVIIAGSTNNLNVKGVAVTLESATWAASGTQVAVKCYFNGINGAFVGR